MATDQLSMALLKKKPKEAPAEIGRRTGADSVDLLQRTADSAEGAAELGPDALYGRDDCHSDQCGNQAILNGSRAGLVSHKFLQELRHQNILQ